MLLECFISGMLIRASIHNQIPFEVSNSLTMINHFRVLSNISNCSIMYKVMLRLMILLISQFFITGLLAQVPISLESKPKSMEAGMPNPPASPTKVKCAIMILNVIEIDDVNESFEAEIVVLASWKDPRLAFDPTTEGTEVKLFQGSYQFYERFNGWWPQLVILNEAGRNEPNAITLRVFPDGTVRYREQRNTVLETAMNLRVFPFDTQKLRATLIPFANTTSMVQLEVDEHILNSSNKYIEGQKELNVAGWQLKHLDMTVDEKAVSFGNKNDNFSQLKTIITVKRLSWQIIWSILFPLMIIVCTVWSIFWLELESLNDRLNISFIGILTIVAYQFVVLEDLPSMSYLTFTDIMLLTSFLMMALTVPQSIIIHRLMINGRQLLAHKVDQISRFAFPLCYVILLLIAALGYGVL